VCFRWFWRCDAVPPVVVSPCPSLSPSLAPFSLCICRHAAVESRVQFALLWGVCVCPVAVAVACASQNGRHAVGGGSRGSPGGGTDGREQQCHRRRAGPGAPCQRLPPKGHALTSESGPCRLWIAMGRPWRPTCSSASSDAALPPQPPRSWTLPCVPRAAGACGPPFPFLPSSATERASPGSTN
jgi:hypothetical protein